MAIPIKTSPAIVHEKEIRNQLLWEDVIQKKNFIGPGSVHPKCPVPKPLTEEQKALILLEYRNKEVKFMQYYIDVNWCN